MELGKGAFGAVRLATHVLSGQQVVFKTIEKYKIASLLRDQGVVGDMEEACMNEARLLERLDHPHVIALHQTINAPKKVHLVMDYVSAGDLWTYVKFRGKLPEPEAARIFRQICLAVQHCHTHKVAHRDIKLDNVMLLEDQTVVLIDFGMAHTTGLKLRQQCGTPMYASPEIWASIPYAGPPADVWALGVSLYLMVVGRPPFQHPNQHTMFKLISAAAYPPPDKLTGGCKGLLGVMLLADPPKVPHSPSTLDPEP
ncbi:kinase-like domain-containing protein [Baffinella frigidus]|nr:kinase-like domain-containing protein [Cryptophyta sp. CCMP2293]